MKTLQLEVQLCKSPKDFIELHYDVEGDGYMSVSEGGIMIHTSPVRKGSNDCKFVAKSGAQLQITIDECRSFGFGRGAPIRTANIIDGGITKLTNSFSDISDLEELTIGNLDSLLSVVSTCKKCPNLHTVEFGTVPNLINAEAAFDGCGNLYNLIGFPDNTVRVQYNTFRGCTALQKRNMVKKKKTLDCGMRI